MVVKATSVKKTSETVTVSELKNMMVMLVITKELKANRTLAFS